ncbi:SAC3 [Candida jiufengensis]|uniref:SAC3 n=1 Tax=Candida jiufengensis TaxID=497108 RepID=UPI0022258164|nr:SAC3 [Candida jiufengensis]KAI5951309.1 SAC3 [Candida jiufengensis]
MSSPFGGFTSFNTSTSNGQSAFTSNNNSAFTNNQSTAFSNNQSTFANGFLPSGNLNQNLNENKETITSKRTPFKNQSKRFGKAYIHSDTEMKSSSPTPTPSSSNSSNGNQSQLNQLQVFKPKDVEITGPLFSNPQAFGFKKQNKNVQPRPIPKYYLTQPKYLVTKPFIQNEWDRQNQIKMTQMETNNQGKDYQGLYEDFQKLREIERKEMETLGLVDAENTAKNLNEAIAFQGSCLDMCPVFERVRRQLENNVKNLEKDPQTNKISVSRAVKAFSRPAAGQPPPLPSEVRPPHVLKTTLDYLIDTIVDKLPEAHSFIWDRTRSIRQDFTYQNSFGPEAVDCNERIVRIHLLSLHIMAGSDLEYSQQQELEQFNKALQTLMEIYQDVRNNGGTSPNEAEFRAYHLLSHIRDPELERQIQNLPPSVFNDSKIQLALKLRKIVSQNNLVGRGLHNLIGALDLYVEFFKVVYSEETPLLMACLLETQFSEIRFYALKAMSRAFHTKGKSYFVSNLANVLGFDSETKLIDFLQYYEIDIINTNGELLVDLFNKDKLESQYKLNSFTDKPRPSPVYSTQLNSKIKGRSLKYFINSGLPNSGFNLKNDDSVLISNQKLPEIPKIQSLPSSTFAISNNNNGVQSNEIKIPSFEPPVQRQAQALPVQQQQKQSFSFESAPQNPFGQPPTKSTSIETQPQPTATPFQFDSSNKTTTFPSTANKSPEPEIDNPQTKPKIDFSFNKPSSIPTTNLFSTKKVTFDSTPEIKEIPNRIDLLNNEQQATALSVKPISSPIPQQKKLIENPKFPNAAQIVIECMLKNVIDEELKEFLPRIIHDHNIQVRRNNVIKSLTSQIFSAFVAEISYESTLELKAVHVYNSSTKKRSMRSLVKKAIQCRTTYQARTKKRNELQSVSFMQSSLKRALSKDDSRDNSSRKKHRGSIENLDIGKKQLELRKFWEPLHLQDFVNTCASNLKLKINDLNLNLKWLLVVENWDTDYSRWLKSKFNLKSNMKLMVYEQDMENDKINLDLTSLPSNDKLNKGFFSKCSFILLECGLCSNSDLSINQKLSTDAKILRKILTMIEKYSFYKAHIIILFWDINQSGLSSQEVTDKLFLHQYGSFKNLKNLILCDMTVAQDQLNEVLNSAVNKIAIDFDGELTNRGLRNEIRLKTKLKVDEETEARSKRQEEWNHSNKLNQLEQKMMNHAKTLKKYDYLTTSYTKPKPPKLNNTSTTFNASTMANKSLAKIIASRGGARSNLSSISSSNSTFLNSSSIISNGSLFNGFGKGVVEESTPINSPGRPSSRVSSISSISHLHNHLQSHDKPKISNEDKLKRLKELAAGIKSKYQQSGLSKEN